MLIVSPFVVVYDLDIPCFTLVPLKADPPLIIDANAVLTASITMQGFEAVAWRNPKVVKLPCRVDSKKFGSRTTLDLVWNPPNRISGEESNRSLVGETLNHNNIAYRVTVRMSR
jgi:hypothetical protein